MKKYRRGSSTISVELLGNNTRFLAFIISAATIVSDKDVFRRTIRQHSGCR